MPSTGHEHAPGKAAASAEALEAMQTYADAHQVHELLRLLLRRLLEQQPAEPLAFLATYVRDGESLDALERRCAARRFDLRRERTKKALALGVFARLLALQARDRGKGSGGAMATGTVDAAGDDGRHLARAFLMEQLRESETRGRLRESFPRHARDLAQWLRANEQQLPRAIDADKFAAVCLHVLATKASAS